MSEPLLELQSVHRHFKGVVAVNDVSLSLAPGQVLAVIGPNGSGKTTLLNMICGIYPPQRGQVEILGRSETGSLRFRQTALLGVARTYQVPRLFPSLTVREHLALSEGRAGDRVLPAPVAAATNDLLASVGLDARPHSEVRTLGHGQLRFLEIAMALLRAPRLLLLDEPTSGLSESEMLVLAELVDCARASGIGVLAVEHHMDWVRRVSDSVIVLHNGNILWEGEPSGFAQSDAVRAAYLGSTGG